MARNSTVDSLLEVCRDMMSKLLNWDYVWINDHDQQCHATVLGYFVMEMKKLGFFPLVPNAAEYKGSVRQLAADLSSMVRLMRKAIGALPIPDFRLTHLCTSVGCRVDGVMRTLPASCDNQKLHIAAQARK